MPDDTPPTTTPSAEQAAIDASRRLTAAVKRQAEMCGIDADARNMLAHALQRDIRRIHADMSRQLSQATLDWWMHDPDT